MNKKILITLGVIAAAGLVGVYFYKKNKSKKAKVLATKSKPFISDTGVDGKKTKTRFHGNPVNPNADRWKIGRNFSIGTDGGWRGGQKF